MSSLVGQNLLGSISSENSAAAFAISKKGTKCKEPLEP